MTVTLIPDPGGANQQFSQSGKTTAVTVNNNGAPNTTPPNPANDPNPFVNAGPWGKVEIGGVRVPGIVRTIDGCNTPEEWQFQKGTNGNYAVSVWRGSKLAESIKITFALLDRESFSGYYALRRHLRPMRGKKPPSHAIVNPSINFGGITRCSIKDVGFPKWQESGGYWLAEIELCEFNPSKTAPTGPADPAKPPKEPSAQDAAEVAAKKVLDEVNKL
jgi:hypothetical protein